MHLPNFNQAFGNNHQQRGIGGSNHQQRGIGGSNHQQRGIGGSNHQQRGIGGSNQRERGTGGSNQRERGIGGNNQRQRGIGGNNQRGIRDRWFDEHVALGDNSQSGSEIHTSKFSLLATFLKAKKWHLLAGVLLLFSAIMSTVAFVRTKDDGGGSSAQVSSDSNVGENVPTVAPVATENSEIPTISTVESAAGDQQPSVPPGPAPTRAPFLWPDGGNGIVLNEVGEIFGFPSDSRVTSISSAVSGDGYTVAVLNRPPDSGTVQVSAYRFDASAAVHSNSTDIKANWGKLGEDIVGEGDVSINGAGQSLALSEDGNTLAIGFFNAACDLGENCGRVRVFSFENTDWSQIGEDVVGEEPNVFLGMSVAISNDGLTMAAGEPFSNSVDGSHFHLGKVKVLRMGSDGVWTSIGTDMEGGSDRDQLGSSVALSADGSTVACAALQAQDDAFGYVKIFQLNDSTGNFVQLGSDIVGDERIEQFGSSVALSDSGLTLAIGGLGMVSVYKLKGIEWIKVGEDIESETPQDFFGYSVALNADGSRLVVGAPESESQAGTAILFEYGERGWLQRGELIEAAYDGTQLGRSVSLDSSGFVVAAGGHFGVQIYHDSGIEGSVSHVGGFTHLGEVIGSGFFSISSTISGDGTTAAVARGMAEGESSARRMNSWAQVDTQVIVSVFRYNSTGAWARVGDDLVFFVGSGDVDAVGKSLALSENGNTLAIGFFSERCEDLAEKCGHVRVYSYESDAWTQLGQNITGEVSNGFLGWSVAISDDGLTVAAGAPQSPGDGGLVRSGKVRVFRLENAQWRQLGPDIEGSGTLDQLGSSLALSGDGSHFVSGAVQGLTASLGYAKVFKFEASTDNFVQVGENIEGDSRTGKFGTAVSLSDDGLTLAVGAIMEGTESDDAAVARAQSFGLVSVFKNENNTWIKVGNDIESGKTGDLFGYSVAISADGSAVIVGAPEDYSDSGSVFVYFLDAYQGTWVQHGNPIYPIETEGSKSQLGRSVAISSSGEVVAAGGRNGIQVYQADFPVDDTPAAPFSPNAAPSVGFAPSTPNASPAPLEVAPETTPSGPAFIQLGEVIGAENDASSFSSTLSGDGTTTAVALRIDPEEVIRVSVYRYNSTSAWNKLGGNVVGVGELDGVGKSLALSEDGNTLAIGFFDELCDLGDNCGRIRVYIFDGSGWIQRGEDIVGDKPFEFFGWSVAISNDGLTIAAGSALSHGENNKRHCGKVRVFRFENGAFRQLGGDLYGDGEWDQLGSSLSLSGDGMIVASGAVQGFVGNLGYVKVYQYADSADNFTQIGTNIVGNNRTDKFGEAVSLSVTGLTLAVGATKGGGTEDDDQVETEPSFGLVSVFRYNESGWIKVGNDVESGTTGDLFGYSVAINDAGNRILVGAPECNSLAGCAMVYDLHQLDGTEAWTQFGEIIQSASNNASLPNELGRSVAISSSGAVFAAGGRAGVQVNQATPELVDKAGAETAAGAAPFAPASSPAGTPTSVGDTTAPFAPASSPTGAPSGTGGGPPTTVLNASQETSAPVVQTVRERPETPSGPSAPSAPSTLSSPAAAPVGETLEPVTLPQGTKETPAPVIQTISDTPETPFGPSAQSSPSAQSAPASSAAAPVGETMQPVTQTQTTDTPEAPSGPSTPSAPSAPASPAAAPVGETLEPLTVSVAQTTEEITEPVERNVPPLRQRRLLEH